MRHITTILLLLASFFFTAEPAQAGLLVKKHTLTHRTASEASEQRKVERMERVASMLGGGKHECDKDGDDCNCNCHKKNTSKKCGWAGTTSMWLAIIGWFYFPPLLIAALAYGARGMRPDSCKKNRAKAGIVIGIAGIFFWTLVLVAATMW